MGRRSIWEPMTDLITLQQAMDRLYNEAWRERGGEWQRGERVDLLRVDAYSTAQELVIVASVPGADPQDVEISIEGETVTITEAGVRLSVLQMWGRRIRKVKVTLPPAGNPLPGPGTGGGSE